MTDHEAKGKCQLRESRVVCCLLAHVVSRRRVMFLYIKIADQQPDDLGLLKRVNVN